MSSAALSGFVRIVTHPKVFRDPTPLGAALEFYQAIVSHPLARSMEPGGRHPQIFQALCRDTQASGSLITDAWFAALALEHELTWVSGDRDYGLFPGLDWRWIKFSPTSPVPRPEPGPPDR